MQALYRRSPSHLVALLVLGTISTNGLFAAVSQGQTLEADIVRSHDAVTPNNEQGAVAVNNDSNADVSPSVELDSTQTIALEEPSSDQTLHVSELSSELSVEAHDLQPEERSPDLATLSDAQVMELADLPQENNVDTNHVDYVAQWRTASSYALNQDNAFIFRIGSRVLGPTALQGATRPRTVLPGSNRSGGVSAIVRVEEQLGSGEVALEVEGGLDILAFDLGYNTDTTAPRRGFGVNIFNQRSYYPAYRQGDRDVDLPNGDEMYLHRLGGGVEYYQPVTSTMNGALGLSYQRVSVRDDLFTSGVEPVDELGDRLTVDGDGIDDLLSLNLALVQDLRDSSIDPTRGYFVRFGMDQGITLGSESVAFNRLSANYTQYIPVSLFGFTEGPRTLVLNLQGGVSIGDTPSYEGFNLGGVNSVRGYDKGSVGTGTRFLQATAEYRFPLFNFDFREEEIAVAGVLFVDYATTLDSQDDVIGEPGAVRDKPGEGLGFGVGLRIRSPIGPIRAEFGLNDNGNSQIYVTTSNRF